MKMTLNGARRWLAALMLTAAALLLGTAAVSAAEAPAVYTTKDEPPFTVMAGEDEAGRLTLGEDLGFYKGRNKKYFLFLPGTADIHAVTVRYDGTKQAYDDRTARPTGRGRPLSVISPAATARSSSTTQNTGFTTGTPSPPCTAESCPLSTSP